MLIINENDIEMPSVTLLLKRHEMVQLIGYAEQLLQSGPGDHSHLSSDDYTREITLSLYDPSDTSMFHESIRPLIAQAELREGKE